MNENNAFSEVIDKFDYSIINIDNKLDCTPIKKIETYIKEIDDTSLVFIALVFKKTFSFLIHHHRINTYPDIIILKEEECILSKDEINLLIKTISFISGKTVKAYIYNALYLFSRNNQFSLMAIECYLSHKSIIDHKNEDCLFFYRMAMSLCNINGDEFSRYKEIIKKDLISITKKNIGNISFLEIYSILSIDKKLEKSIKLMFAELISDIAIKLIVRERDIILKYKNHSKLLLSLGMNLTLYANKASGIYKEIEYSNSISILNANIVKSLLSLVDSISTLENNDIIEGLQVQFCFIAEHYKNNSSRSALSEIGCNIYDVEMMINRVKINSVKKVETFTLSIHGYTEELDIMIEKTESASDALSLLGQYKFKDIYPLDYTCDKKLNNESFENLFKTITISNDGRTISHNQKINHYTMLFFSLYGGVFNTILSTIVTKFSNPVEIVKDMVENSYFIPEKIKPFIFHGLERWLSGDITSALFILIPQYESFVRNSLKERSISTITTNNGCQDEISLPNLMKKTETASILSRDFFYEIEKLLTDSSGANLRHKVAHGLLTSEDLNNSISYYICWRWLSVVTGSFNPLFSDDK